MERATMVKENKDYKLFEANDIAKYGLMFAAGKLLSPIAYKALMYLIWKGNIETPGKLETVELSISELGEALGYHRDKNYNFSHNVKRVCEVIKDIMAKPVRIHDVKEKKFITFLWLQYVEADYKHDKIKVIFGCALANHFGQELQKNFTVIKLKYLNRMSTTASVLLYPFFSRYLKLKQFNYSVEELSKLLTGESDYEYRFLKKDYLVPAIRAINAYTDLHVEFKEKKNGRKVISFNFVIQKEPAEDELKKFMEHNKLKADEVGLEPYNEKWMKFYNYDMGKQEYVKK